ncbi:MAG: hypothetical protein JSW07_07385 [bacterium]|nr:MAG: hypothetical protein JSW07_07385 [bacterium]
MRNMNASIQKDLFDSSRSQELHMRIKELDVMIKRALKDSKYNEARALTEEQEQIIKELVDADESEVNRKK